MDGTTDELVRRIGSNKVFRFNVDLWRDYNFRFTSEEFQISDPTGRECNHLKIMALYVRKPTFDDPIVVPLGGGPENWIRAEISYMIQELYCFCDELKIVRLVEKGAERRFGKFAQLRMAKEFFKVPDWQYIRSSHSISFDGDCVTKSLSMEFVRDSMPMFTRSVNPAELSPDYPWFLQRKIDADADVTIAYVAGECFAFELDRNSFTGVDWRPHIYAQDLTWNRITIPNSLVASVRAYMSKAGLKFGRLDFLRRDTDFFFLEVNPNGQWAWLDLDGNEGLFDAVVKQLTSGWMS